MKQILVNNKYDCFIVILCLLVLTLSFYLSIGNNDSISAEGFENHYGDLCLFKQMTGVPCPSCGLTRGFIAISHLKFEKALNYNIACLMIYIIFLVQIPYRVILILKSKSIFISKIEIVGSLYFYMTIFILFAGWFYRLFANKII